jgi:2-dehydropantoate 2-reductase
VTFALQTLIDELRAARIDAVPAADQWLARWKKLMWNIPFNGLSVVLNAKSDHLINHPESASLAESLMREIRESALACGRDVPESAVEEMLEHTRKMVPYDSSMRLDYLANRPLEVEAIFGVPVRTAQAAGYDPKQVRMLYQQLKFLSV